MSTVVVDSAVIDKADDLLEAKNYTKAAKMVEKMLKNVPKIEDFNDLSRAALIKGKALLAPLLAQHNNKKRKNPSPEEFREPAELFKLAVHLDDDNADAVAEIESMHEQGFISIEQAPLPEEPNHPEPIDVLIVGAGASGVGLGVLMTSVFG